MVPNVEDFVIPLMPNLVRFASIRYAERWKFNQN